MDNKQKKELVKTILDKFKVDLQKGDLQPVINYLGASLTTESRFEMLKIFNDCGIDYLNHITEIPKKFFEGSDIKSLSLPDNITKIGEKAFANCKQLQRIDLPKSYSEIIPDFCFQGCSSLKSIYLPDKCRGVGTYAFHDCPELEAIIIKRYIPKAEIDKRKAKEGPNYTGKRIFSSHKNKDGVAEIAGVIKWIDPTENPEDYLK